MRNALLLLPLLLGTGCASLGTFGPQKPETLAPIRIERSSAAVFDEARAVAFEEGYGILFSSEEEGIIEMEVFVREVFLPDRLRRIALLVRKEGERSSLLQARYHSFHASGGGFGAREDDREAAEALVARLEQRLNGTASRR